MGPGQAHRSSLVYNLCCCLILVVCVIETYQLTKPSLTFFKYRVKAEWFAKKFSVFYHASDDFLPVPAQLAV